MAILSKTFATFGFILMLVSALPTAALANQSCKNLGLLVQIVELTNLVTKHGQSVSPEKYDSLWALINGASVSPLERRLIQAGHGSQMQDVNTYLKTVNSFLQIRRVNGAAFGRSTLNKPSFQARHTRMLALAKDLCTQSLTDKLKGLRDQATTALGLNPAGKLKTNTFEKLVSGNAQKRRLNDETRRLVMVFLGLSTAMLALLALNYAMKFARAVHLSRYDCTIPSRIVVNGEDLSGIINILGRRGLSFQLLGTSDQSNSGMLLPGQTIRFQTDAYNFKAVLTKTFDDGSGFRLIVPFTRPQIKKLLLLSKSPTQRRINFQRKKKPTKPTKVSLA